MKLLSSNSLLFLLLAVCAARPVGAITEIRNHVFASGGGSLSSASHTLRYTIGQSFIAGGTSPSHTVGAGFWGTSLSVSSVDTEIPPVLPIADRLHQNHPNPFNPATHIQYDLAGTSGHVRLRIYDLAGHLVTTLVDEVQMAGTQTTIWRGIDKNGAAVSSGVYTYILETPRTRFTKKMVLLR